MTDMETRLFERFPWLRDLHLNLQWGFQCGPGWQRILTSFFATVEEQLPGGNGFHLRQIKEKLGGLVIYYWLHPQQERVYRAIEQAATLAAARSFHTCEACGAPGILRSASGYHFVSCDEHSRPNGRKSRVLKNPTGYLCTTIRDDGDWSRYDPERDAFVDSPSPAELYDEAEKAVLESKPFRDLGPLETDIDIAETATRLQKEAEAAKRDRDQND
jgi:ssDNA-binding Zn-finger/Zn-ribbon topoisomerase 1